MNNRCLWFLEALTVPDNRTLEMQWVVDGPIGLADLRPGDELLEGARVREVVVTDTDEEHKRACERAWAIFNSGEPTFRPEAWTLRTA